MANLKVAVITDGRSVPRFLLEAIDQIAGCEEISVFACTNTVHKRRLLKNGAYYALNLLSIRNIKTRPVSIAASRKRVGQIIEFESGYDGVWQTLPATVVAELTNRRFDVVLKFGMGLLRVPPAEQLPIPILSYHHGDPDRYCGRPAGFWEMIHEEPVMGQIVQIISNKVDAGRVVAFAETKVHLHSYRATLIEAYTHSPFLINQAIRSAMAGSFLGKKSGGKNYRLPSNVVVVRLALRCLGLTLKRLIYGTFREKRWRVSSARTFEPTVASLTSVGSFPAAETWHTLPVPKPYTFYADPFFVREPHGVLVEALNGRNGLGEILFVNEQGTERLLWGNGHASYPMTVEVEGRQIILPETTSWAPPTCFSLSDGKMVPLMKLRVQDEPSVLDPTLIEHENSLYLFGNSSGAGAHALRLWSAPSLADEFRQHPLSPIRISPAGGRMAGNLLREKGRIFRFGQNFVDGYGHGIFAFEVEELTPLSYRERFVGEIRFSDRFGPHTLNLSGAEMVFDWYFEAISPLAGFRRLLALARGRFRSGPRNLAGSLPPGLGGAADQPADRNSRIAPRNC